jgi:hypothetical protein
MNRFTHAKRFCLERSRLDNEPGGADNPEEGCGDARPPRSRDLGSGTLNGTVFTSPSKGT